MRSRFIRCTLCVGLAALACTASRIARAAEKENLLAGRSYVLHMKDYSTSRELGDLTFTGFSPPDWRSVDGRVVITGQQCAANWLVDGKIATDQSRWHVDMPHNDWKKYKITPNPKPWEQDWRQWEFHFDFSGQMWFDEVVIHMMKNPFDMHGGRPPERLVIMATDDGKTFTLGRICNVYEEIDSGNMCDIAVKLAARDLNLKGKTLVIVGSHKLVEVEAYGRKATSSDPEPGADRLYPDTNIFSLYWRGADLHIADRYLYTFLNARIGADLQRIHLTLPPEVEIGSTYRYTITDLGGVELFGKASRKWELNLPVPNKTTWIEPLFLRSREKGPRLLGPALIETFRGSEATGFTKARRQRFNVYAVDIPWTEEKPKRLLTSGPWLQFAYLTAWPDALESYGQMGFSALGLRQTLLVRRWSTYYSDKEGGFYDKFPDAPRDTAAVMEKLLEAGIKPIGAFVGVETKPPASPNPSPFVRLKPDGSTETIDSAICPFYELEHIAPELVEDYRRCGEMGIQYYDHDWEAEYGGTGWDRNGCFCEGCKARVRAYFRKNYPELSADRDPVAFMSSKDPDDKPCRDAWMQFWYDYLADRFLMNKNAATEGLASRGMGPARFSHLMCFPWDDHVYGHHSYHDYNTLLKKGVLDDVATRNERILNPAVSSNHRFVKRALPKGVGWIDFPYLNANSIDTVVSSRHIKQYFLNAFAAGLKGMIIDNGRGLNALDYKMLCEVMHQVIPLEDIILDGSPITSDRLSFLHGGWGHGMELKDEALIYATMYWIGDKMTRRSEIWLVMPDCENATVIDMSTETEVASRYKNGILKFAAEFSRDDERFAYNEGKIFHVFKGGEHRARNR